jgi:4-hydroxybenzoate polyprenyltransferase
MLMHYSYSRRVSTLFTLGRVSNLPTVWTNVLAGTLLSGEAADALTLGTLLLAMSCAYVGGMFLNDAFDRDLDAVERPNRPIPAGLISPAWVFGTGFGLLILATALSFAVSNSLLAGLSCAGLCCCIVAYDVWHKGNPFSPVLMGLCRCFVYLTCAIAVTGEVSWQVLTGGLVTLGYVIGLTYAAKQENLLQMGNLWPLVFLASPVVVIPLAGDFNALCSVALISICLWCLPAIALIVQKNIGVAVARLIAGISLVDGALICMAASQFAWLRFDQALLFWLSCLASCVLTLSLQRFYPGT